MVGKESRTAEGCGHKFESVFHHSLRWTCAFFQTFINYAGPLRIETSFSVKPHRISKNPGYVRGKECDEESRLQPVFFSTFLVRWSGIGKE